MSFKSSVADGIAGAIHAAGTTSAAAAGLTVNGSNANNLFHLWVSNAYCDDPATHTEYQCGTGIAIKDYNGNGMSPGGPCRQFRAGYGYDDPTALWCNFLGEVVVNTRNGNDRVEFHHSELGTPYGYYADVDGGDGADVIVAGDSAGVTMIGGTGYDYFYGSPFSDYMTDADGGEMHGYGGMDHFNGGSNTTVDYYDSGFAGVRVVVGGGWISGDADAIDPCMGRIVGTYYSDNITGDNCANAFDGREGDDTIDGGRGADFLDGGIGYNTVNYLSIDEGVQVSVDGTQPQTQFDTLLHFSVIQGSRGHDVIYGTGGDDTIVGGSGWDTIYGLDGNDSIYGDVDPGQGIKRPGTTTSTAARATTFSPAVTAPIC